MADTSRRVTVRVDVVGQAGALKSSLNAGTAAANQLQQKINQIAKTVIAPTVRLPTGTAAAFRPPAGIATLTTGLQNASAAAADLQAVMNRLGTTKPAGGGASLAAVAATAAAVAASRMGMAGIAGRFAAPLELPRGERSRRYQEMMASVADEDKERVYTYDRFKRGKKPKAGAGTPGGEAITPIPFAEPIPGGISEPMPAAARILPGPKVKPPKVALPPKPAKLTPADIAAGLQTPGSDIVERLVDLKVATNKDIIAGAEQAGVTLTSKAKKKRQAMLDVLSGHVGGLKVPAPAVPAAGPKLGPSLKITSGTASMYGTVPSLAGAAASRGELTTQQSILASMGRGIPVAAPAAKLTAFQRVGAFGHTIGGGVAGLVGKLPNMIGKPLTAGFKALYGTYILANRAVDAAGKASGKTDAERKALTATLSGLDAALGMKVLPWAVGAGVGVATGNPLLGALAGGAASFVPAASLAWLGANKLRGRFGGKGAPAGSAGSAAPHWTSTGAVADDMWNPPPRRRPPRVATSPVMLGGFPGAMAVPQAISSLRFLADASIKRTESQALLSHLRSGAGASAFMRQSTLDRQLSTRQDWLTRVSEHGRFGAGLGLAAERFAPIAGAARTGAMVGAGIMAAGVHSLPELSQQLTNSFAMLAREIGISVTPQVVRLSGWLQAAARATRNVNEASGGAAGAGLFYGTLALGGVVAAGSALNMVRGAAHGIGWAGRALGFAGEAAAPAVGQVVGSGIVRAGGAIAGRGAGTGLSTAAQVGGPAVVATIGGIGLGVGAVASGAALAGVALFAASLTGVIQAAQYRAGPEADKASVGNFAANFFAGLMPGGHLMSQGLAGFYSTQFGREQGLLGAATGAVGGLEPTLQIDRQPQIGGDVTALYDRILMGAVGKTPEQAEQEARAMQELITAINTLNGTIAAANPPERP